MPSSDRTSDFRETIREKELEIPETKRRKLSKFTRGVSGRDDQAHIGKEYIAEAYVIVSVLHMMPEVIWRLRFAPWTVESHKHVDPHVREYPKAILERRFPKCTAGQSALQDH